MTGQVRRPRAITKTLSANDTGETGGHQAGMLVPKDPGVLSFFPRLRDTTKNPRQLLHVTDESGGEWGLAFIYYNSRQFGGTRNEYRLTRLTRYIRANNLKAGDQLTIYREEDGRYRLAHTRSELIAIERDGRVKLGTTWRVISL